MSKALLISSTTMIMFMQGPMCFRCLMFSLSEPCELLFLLCFIASWQNSTLCTVYSHANICILKHCIA